MNQSAVHLSKWFINHNKDVANPSFDGNVKLQKLLYYSKAMYYAVYEESLFINDVEAWANGPVVSEVFTLYRHHNLVEEAKKSIDNLRIDGKVERVLKVVNHVYGSQTARQLIELTHQEEPWKELEEQAQLKMNPKISEEKIREYYQPLKDIFEMIEEDELENTVYDRINGNVFSYDRTETILSDKDLEVLSRYGETIRDNNYFVYRDEEGNLVVY